MFSDSHSEFSSMSGSRPPSVTETSVIVHPPSLTSRCRLIPTYPVLCTGFVSNSVEAFDLLSAPYEPLDVGQAIRIVICGDHEDAGTVHLVILEQLYSATVKRVEFASGRRDVGGSTVTDSSSTPILLCAERAWTAVSWVRLADLLARDVLRVGLSLVPSRWSTHDEADEVQPPIPDHFVFGPLTSSMHTFNGCRRAIPAATVQHNRTASLIGAITYVTETVISPTVSHHDSSIQPRSQSRRATRTSQGCY
ncbi:hypothetical protein C8Q76DRAFT_804122 [Earliella scabrosa]|nr:hypothetical protein C8Q76DRAFT_804122 [Earliella scabrosa]